MFRGFNALLYKEFLVALRDPMAFFMLFPSLVHMTAFGCGLDNDPEPAALSR